MKSKSEIRRIKNFQHSNKLLASFSLNIIKIYETITNDDDDDDDENNAFHIRKKQKGFEIFSNVIPEKLSRSIVH